MLQNMILNLASCQYVRASLLMQVGLMTEMSKLDSIVLTNLLIKSLEINKSPDMHYYSCYISPFPDNSRIYNHCLLSLLTRLNGFRITTIIVCF